MKRVFDQQVHVWLDEDRLDDQTWYWSSILRMRWRVRLRTSAENCSEPGRGFQPEGERHLCTMRERERERHKVVCLITFVSVFFCLLPHGLVDDQCFAVFFRLDHFSVGEVSQLHWWEQNVRRRRWRVCDVVGLKFGFIDFISLHLTRSQNVPYSALCLRAQQWCERETVTPRGHKCTTCTFVQCTKHLLLHHDTRGR